MPMILNAQLTPRPYQSDAVEWALSCDTAVCCLPTGTGKTLVGLLWAGALLDLILIDGREDRGYCASVPH